jgi:hypothetical protein
VSSDHDPTACAAVDHQYWTFIVFWCPHRQQFTLRRSTYVETGTGVGIDQYESDSIALGPFDQGDDVADLLAGWLRLARQDWDRTSPRPPGSSAKSPTLSGE